MENCKCGKKVRLRAFKINMDRKNGISKYLQHMDGSKVCEIGEWNTLMMKPYPRYIIDWPSTKMIQEWNYKMKAASEKT